MGWRQPGTRQLPRYHWRKLIGAFVSARAISGEPGILPYIYVQGIDAVIESIKVNGGQVLQDPYPEENLWIATFRDPQGNTPGIWQSDPR